MQRKKRNKECTTIITDIMVKILKSWFKSFGTVNELIITHPPHIKTSDLAQQILNNQEEIDMLKNIIVDLKKHEKQLEKVL